MDKTYYFRGKTVKTKEWVYGYLVGKAFDGTSRNVEVGIQKDRCYPDDVLPETVGQYVGVKDHTGVLIFAGDILKGSVGIGVVVLVTGRCSFAVKVENSPDIHFIESEGNLKNTVVVGNVYDNPELLK
jgi:hypothetical protein